MSDRNEGDIHAEAGFRSANSWHPRTPLDPSIQQASNAQASMLFHTPVSPCWYSAAFAYNPPPQSPFSPEYGLGLSLSWQAPSLLSQVVRRRARTVGFQPQSHLTPNVPLHHSPKGRKTSVTFEGWGIHAWKPSSGRRCPITPMPYHAVSRAPASTRLQAQSHTPPTATRQPWGMAAGRPKRDPAWRSGIRKGMSRASWCSRAGDGTHPKIKKEEIKITRRFPLRQTSPHLGRRPGWDAVSCVLIWWHPIPKAWPSCRGKGQAPEGAD
jgi:hypothetical protein